MATRRESNAQREHSETPRRTGPPSNIVTVDRKDSRLIEDTAASLSRENGLRLCLEACREPVVFRSLAAAATFKTEFSSRA